VVRQPRQRRILVGLIAVLLLSAFAIAGRSTGAQPARPTRCGEPWRATVPYFAPQSPFNQPIAAGAPIDPRSHDMVQGVVKAGADGHFTLAVKLYTTAVYLAGPKTRVVSVRLTADWAQPRVLANVPLPDGARPDPSSDGHLAIIDRASGCEYDFWQARVEAGGLTAASGGRISLWSHGVFRHSSAATASGIALTAGLIFPVELRSGSIRHALAMGYPFTRSGGPVPPASQSDGRSDGPTAIPEGARIRLDPSLDLSALTLRPYELTIARALQVYGAFIVDTSGAVGFPAAHPQSYAHNPYAGILPDGTFVSLSRIPLDHFQVLELPR
jgi:hypothetical protein